MRDIIDKYLGFRILADVVNLRNVRIRHLLYYA
jgi:hypothetical protein